MGGWVAIWLRWASWREATCRSINTPNVNTARSPRNLTILDTRLLLIMMLAHGLWQEPCDHRMEAMSSENPSLVGLCSKLTALNELVGPHPHPHNTDHIHCTGVSIGIMHARRVWVANHHMTPCSLRRGRRGSSTGPPRPPSLSQEGCSASTLLALAACLVTPSQLASSHLD